MRYNRLTGNASNNTLMGPGADTLDGGLALISTSSTMPATSSSKPWEPDGYRPVQHPSASPTVPASKTFEPGAQTSAPPAAIWPIPWSETRESIPGWRAGRSMSTVDSPDVVLELAGAGTDTIERILIEDDWRSTTTSPTPHGQYGHQHSWPAAWATISTSSTASRTWSSRLQGGADTIQTGITYSLAAIANVENLTLSGGANVNGTGNSLANVLYGNTGTNVLSGGQGTIPISSRIRPTR